MEQISNTDLTFPDLQVSSSILTVIRRSRFSGSAGSVSGFSLTHGGGGGGGRSELVDVAVDGRQVVDDVTAQSSLLQHVAPVLGNGMQPFALFSKDAVTLHEVLTQVHFGAVALETTAAVRPRAFVIVHTHLSERARARERENIQSLHDWVRESVCDFFKDPAVNHIFTESPLKAVFVTNVTNVEVMK